ncbi:MAG: hypothetical protein CR979_03545 [Propionibacterium sp.]|nr:MAG: hypothetical protein CR979_03545 [Propionibacterium sp.]
MHTSNKLVWRVYSGVLGAVTTLIAQQLISKAWQTATGEQPPNPNDPEVPIIQAMTWAIATGVGVGVTQLSMNRYMAKRWLSNTGYSAPSNLRNKLSD